MNLILIPMSNQVLISSPWIHLLHVLVLMTVVTVCATSSDADRKVHIVYMGDQTNAISSVHLLHRSMLEEITGRDASESLVHSYHRSFNGFAAWFTDKEVEKIAGMSSVVSVFSNKKRKLHTTRSWDFIELPTEATREQSESDVIIGMLDTGIWPESDSFRDEGFGPPPSKWKGTCQSSNFTCNNKIIGARYYRSSQNFIPGDLASPRDSEGHGTHTSSTASGLQVEGASLLGLAKGTARGGVPSSRIAVYKICWSDGCSDADILAAFDDAIADGVDIVSISVGGAGARDYFEDSIAIGSFHAMKNGILTSNSAGNEGPDSLTVENYSPWSLTVAAGTIDRRITASVKLGNGKLYEGVAVNTFDLKGRMYPLVYAGNAPNISAGYNSSTSRFCSQGSLDEKVVRGKIVLCDALSGANEPYIAGALGTVMTTEVYLDTAFSFPIPATVLDQTEGEEVFLYTKKTRHPKATILFSQQATNPAAPYVASFSSRGPNPVTRDILKPDLIAPGVDILAAWSPLASNGRAPSTSYNIISGTSMACPHATAAAAYIKSFHTSWSPAAIKSALMTTAYPMESSTNSDAEFAYGSGYIFPVHALNPGLVYDAGAEDYIRMLCAEGYTNKNLSLLTGGKSKCSTTNRGSVWDLNYPSFALSVASGKTFSARFRRTVTNVGLASSTYEATIRNPSQLEIRIEPSTFMFESVMEKQTFTLHVEGVTTQAMVSASLELYDGVHLVRSPVVVYTI